MRLSARGIYNNQSAKQDFRENCYCDTHKRASEFQSILSTVIAQWSDFPLHHHCWDQSCFESTTITPWSRVFLEKLTVAQLVKLLTFYGTHKFITIFTTANHWSLSHAHPLIPYLGLLQAALFRIISTNDLSNPPNCYNFSSSNTNYSNTLPQFPISTSVLITHLTTMRVAKPSCWFLN